MNLRVPSVFQERLSDLREFEACRIIHKYVGTRGPVLNVGCSWGRDTIFLSQQGLHVVSLDIDFMDQEYACGTVWPDSVQGNATKLPFKDAVFASVVMAECLEHIVDDHAAIGEVRRVLQPGGRLILTVPRVTGGKHDHVRGYSPLAAKRLLTRQGLTVKRVILRGGIITWAHIMGPAILKLKLERFRQTILKVATVVDFCLGVIQLPLLNRSRYSGCYVVSTKKGRL
ncbi:MAG: class I SAM-dependent methyltransferase [Desulfobacterales bacterium]|nr:MAG: class I SAM-dependent methyltransferase [Desulfobacterales bacterium]